MACGLVRWRRVGEGEGTGEVVGEWGGVVEEADGRGEPGRRDGGAGSQRPRGERRGWGTAGGRRRPDRWAPPVSRRKREKAGALVERAAWAVSGCGPRLKKRKEGEGEVGRCRFG
jgi:hypothetical protein